MLIILGYVKAVIVKRVYWEHIVEDTVIRSICTQHVIIIFGYDFFLRVL
jgi:hypothetical protein